MSNANRDYAIVYDVKNSSLVLSRPLIFYLTDKNTSNIFVRLVTRVIIGDGIDQYTDIENASSYVLTMRVIKPDDEIKSIIATQHEPESIFQFDLTEDFKDVPGKYICELTISNIVNGRQEFTTSDSFTYEVKRSILSRIDQIIEHKETTVEKLLNELDATKAELSSQIKEKANEIDLEVERKRIDSFTRLQEGSTTGDAELIDGRIGADGTIYNNIGDSIRSQYNQLEKGVDDLKAFKNKVVFIFNKNEGNGYLTNKGVINNDASMRCIYTDDIDCRVGDVFLYKGFAEGNAVSCLFKKDNKIISYAQYNSKNRYTEITIPSNVNKVVFTSFEYTTNIENVTFDLKIKNTTLEEKINNLETKSNEMQSELELFNQNIDCTTLVIQNYTTIGAWLGKDGGTSSDSGSTCTDYIACKNNDKFYVTGHSQYNTCIIATYDENKKFLRAYGYDSEGASVNHVDFEFLPKDDEKFAKFSSYQTVIVVKKLELSSVTEYINGKTQAFFNSNILYGKKYVACGDSFTEGDFTGYVDEDGLSYTNSPVIYDADWRMYKTYPWWISRRNGMKLVNEAKCGSVFTNYNNGAGNPFSVSRYLNVPTDADYITLMFGLNESGLTDEQIGRKTDNTNTTLWGAYNIVFEHFLTNMPYAKIGVIIPDAWMNEKYANAVKEICAYWGIPVLDLKFDNNIPMGIGGRPGASSKAQELRDKVFQVTDSNSHPSIKAHEYRSTIIENFLRSL